MVNQAQFISLSSLDEREDQKIVRFRCDAPREPYYVHRGILGVMTLEKSAVGDFEEDHALIAVRKLDGLLNQFCTPLAKAGQPLATDLVLKEHITRCTRAFAADGAGKERRALKRHVPLLGKKGSFQVRPSLQSTTRAISRRARFAFEEGGKHVSKVV